MFSEKSLQLVFIRLDIFNSKGVFLTVRFHSVADLTSFFYQSAVGFLVLSITNR